MRAAGARWGCVGAQLGVDQGPGNKCSYIAPMMLMRRSLQLPYGFAKPAGRHGSHTGVQRSTVELSSLRPSARAEQPPIRA